MLFCNLISNAIGVSITMFLSNYSSLPDSISEAALSSRLNTFFLPFSFITPLVLIIWYEQPIRRHLNNLFVGRAVPPPIQIQVQRRLLNEPFVLIGINAVVWAMAATFFPLAFWRFGIEMRFVTGVFFSTMLGGLVTVVVAFFVLEFFLQYRLCPIIFPDGGLHNTPKTFRIRIRTRLIAFLMACNLIPLFSLTREVWTAINYASDPKVALQTLYQSVLLNALVFAAVGVWLIFLVNGNLTRSIGGMVTALHAVRKGDFSKRVKVTSNDELGYAGDVINEMTAGLKERAFIKELFGKYVSKEIRDEILSQQIPLDGELKDVTILFADLRNFTPLVERTSPTEVVRIINRYFEEMEKIISAHRGLILQFIGDEIEAVFGAPIAIENHPDMALQAAMAMHQQLAKVNCELEKQGHPPLSHGIGLHSGEVLAANIGSPQRLSYAMVGDTVNIAARLQGLNKRFGTHIVASEVTVARAQDAYPLQALPATKIKGKSNRVSLFGV